MANRRRPETHSTTAASADDAWRTVRAVAAALNEGSDAAFTAALRAVVSHPGIEGASLTVAPTTDIGLPLRLVEGIPPYPSSAFVRVFSEGATETGRLEVRLAVAAPLVDECAATMADLIGQAITRRRHERAVMAAQRAEVAGAITAGVAHDLNNVMAAVIGSATLLRLQRSGDHEVVRFTEQIEQVAWGGSRLARELLRFVRGLDEPEPAIPLADILGGAAQLAAPLLPSAPVHLGEIEGRPHVAGVRVLLEQAVVNLLLHHGRAPGSEGVAVSVRIAHGHVGITVRGGPTTPTTGARRGQDLETARLIAERHGGSLHPGTAAGEVASHLLTLPLAPETETAPELGAV